jgi:hypothetical protein
VQCICYSLLHLRLFLLVQDQTASGLLIPTPTKCSTICLSRVIRCEALLIACYLAPVYTDIAVALGNASCASKMYIRFVAAALMAHLAPKTKFLRAGRWSEVGSAILVPGYIVSVKFGDIIPIDAPLLEGDPLKIDQSAATEIPIAMPISAIAAKAKDATARELVRDDVFRTPVHSNLLCFYVSRQFLGVLAGYTSSRLYQMFSLWPLLIHRFK